jgi:hypothetical protein
MTGRVRRHRAVGLASLTAAAFAVSSGAQAFELDGQVTAADNYTTVYELEFRVTNVGYPDPGPTQYLSGGSLRIGRDPGPSGDVWMLLEVPIELGDNIYGTSAHVLNGWVYSGHSFTSLADSDLFSFNIKIKDGTWNTVGLDYINPSSPWDVNQGQSDSGNVVEDHYTSLQYNLVENWSNTSYSPDPSDNNPAVPTDWIRAIQYEMRLDGTKFTTTPTLAELGYSYIHVSPNKLKGDNSVTIPCLKYDNCLVVNVNSPPPGIAEPASAAILLAGLTAAGVFRRRRRKQA